MTTNIFGDRPEEDYKILGEAKEEIMKKSIDFSINPEILSLNVVLEAIKIAKQKEKAKLSKYLIDQLSATNPYPSDIFIPRSKEEMKAVSDLIAKAGYSPDAVFGQFGRQVWNNAVDKLKDLSEY